MTTQPILTNKQKLYQFAGWLATGMALIWGFQYLKQLITFVLTELYRLLIQG